MVAALATMLVGILGAVAQTDIKRLLSFTLVSHIGFMVFGIALSSRGRPRGRRSSTSSTTSPCRRRCSSSTGLIERRGGTTSLDRLGGLAKFAPFLAVLFFVPAMNLAGIPPFSGFLGKVGLHPGRGGRRDAAGLGARRRVRRDAACSPCTPWSRRGTRRSGRPRPTTSRPMRLPRGMVASAAALVALGVALTVVAGPLYGYTDVAADDLRARDRRTSTRSCPTAAAGHGISDRRGPSTATAEAPGHRPCTARRRRFAVHVADPGVADHGLGAAVGRPVGRQRAGRPGRRHWS